MLTFPVYKVLSVGPRGPQRGFAVRETTEFSPPEPRLLDRIRTAQRRVSIQWPNSS